MLVALSGGPDSTALLLALLELGHDIVAAHFDHALREGSAADAASVAVLCERVGVPLRIVRRQQSLPSGSLQAAARAVRYEFLERSRRDSSAHLIAVGHTADDAVEGAVLHMLRGTGLAGMRGMPAAHGTVVRPLLGVWRTEIAEYLQQRGVVALEDPANRDVRHARVRARLELLPALERARPGIRSRLHAATRSAARLQAELESTAASLHEGTRAACGPLREAPEAVRREALRQMYVAAGGSSPGLSRRHLAAMDRLVCVAGPGRELHLPGRIRIQTGYTNVDVIGSMSPTSAAQPAYTVDLRVCAGCSRADAVHLKAPARLSIGFRRPGLTIRRAGGTRKLQDILVDGKVPRSERDRLPLLFVDDRLGWVPGIAHDVRCCAGTKGPGLHVQLKRIPEAGRSFGNPMVDSTNYLQGVIPV